MTGTQSLTREAFDRIRREVDLYEIALQHQVTAITIHESDVPGRKEVVFATTSPSGLYKFDTCADGSLLLARSA